MKKVLVAGMIFAVVYVIMGLAHDGIYIQELLAIKLSIIGAVLGTKELILGSFDDEEKQD